VQYHLIVRTEVPGVMKHGIPSDYKKAVLAVVVVSGVGVGAALIARHLWKREKNVHQSAEKTEKNSKLSSIVEPVCRKGNRCDNSIILRF